MDKVFTFQTLYSMQRKWTEAQQKGQLFFQVSIAAFKHLSESGHQGTCVGLK